MTAQTKNILSAENLAKTKKGVRIINCARGGLVDEAALRAALDSGHVAGAAFDVFVEEPATANPLFGHPNVVATPHLGASTTEAQENVALQVAEQMSDYLVRGAITNAVNFPSITAEEAPKLKPFIALAEGLGSFAGQLTDDPIVKVTITYEGGVAGLKTKALTSAAIAGLLRPSLADVNVVSAPAVAAQRGIVIEEATRAAAGDYESFITLAVTTGKQERAVGGTVFHDGKPRILSIKGIKVDAEFTPVDDLCHQRGQAGLHRPLRQPARRGRGQHRHLRPRPRPRGRLGDRAGRDRRPGAGSRARQGREAPRRQAGEGAEVLNNASRRRDRRAAVALHR